MDRFHATTESPRRQRLIWIAAEILMHPETVKQPTSTPSKGQFAPLRPVRQWLDGIEMSDRDMAHVLCSVIPAQCPFERTVTMFGRPLFHIPPLCKLNPFYDQLVGLRFRALCYLADVCGEDISIHC